MASSISVIVATKDRETLLAQTLAALAVQTLPRDRGEIIVADNASGDGTREVVERAAARGQGFPVRYLHVPQPGKSSAVNRALESARGDLIAFTDDDVLPEPVWLEKLQAAVDETGADFIAGRIVPIWEAPAPVWMSPALYGVIAVPDNGLERLPIALGRNEQIIPIGANMAVRASVVRRRGGLRPDLGKLGGTLRTGEDHEFFLRMIHDGCRGIYEPLATVHHWVPRARLDRRYFRAWYHQNGRDVARLESAYPSAVRFLGVPRYLWRAAAIDGAAALRGTVTLDSPRRFAAVLRLIWLAGYAHETWNPQEHARSRVPIQAAEGP